MKYNAVARNTLGGIVPYVSYDHVTGRYSLLDPEIVQNSVEVVFDLEVLPASLIPVEDPSLHHAVKAYYAASLYSSIATMDDGTYSLERESTGLVQVQVIRNINGTIIHGRSAFVNPDVLMEDDGYIPYSTSTDLVELRRMMSQNPINP